MRFKLKNKSFLENKEKKNFNSAVARYKNKRKKEIIILSTIILLVILFFLFINSNYVKLKNINISGLTQIDKNELLNDIGINNDVKIWKVKKSEIEDKIKRNYNIVSEVNVETYYFQTINIAIKEKKVLAREKNSENNYKILLEDGNIYSKQLVNDYNLPLIEGFEEDNNKKHEILKNLAKLDLKVLSQISEILNDKSNIDIAVIYMKDGQKIKINASSFSNKLNYYFEIEKHITDKTNTTLNLVNGAYVETEKTIKEKEDKIKAILKESNTLKNTNTDNSIANSNNTKNTSSEKENNDDR